MFHFIVAIPCLMVIARFLAPLRWPLWVKIALASRFTAPPADVFGLWQYVFPRGTQKHGANDQLAVRHPPFSGGVTTHR